MVIVAFVAALQRPNGAFPYECQSLGRRRWPCDSLMENRHAHMSHSLQAEQSSVNIQCLFLLRNAVAVTNRQLLRSNHLMHFRCTTMYFDQRRVSVLTKNYSSYKKNLWIPSQSKSHCLGFSFVMKGTVRELKGLRSTAHSVVLFVSFCGAALVPRHLACPSARSPSPTVLLFASACACA